MLNKALVTGGCGFIGSTLVDELIRLNFDVTVIDNLSADCHDQPYYNSKALYAKSDISDYKLIEPLFDGVSYVFHLAAEARIQPTIADPCLAIKTNVLGTCNVLQAARQHKVTRVMFSSTSAAYGLKNSGPLKETMERDCLNPYSVSKCSGEDLCKMYSSVFGLETIIFRYFNVFGDRQPTKGQYAPVVGLFQKQYAEGVPMTVVGDGLQTRDYVHVSDVVNANVKAMCAHKSLAGEIFNVGTGRSYSVLDLVYMIGGDTPSFMHMPARIGESKDTLADCTKISKALSWYPQTKIEDFIRSKQKV